MATRKENNTGSVDQKKNNSPASTLNSKDAAKAAYSEAEKDISKDPDLSVHSPNDDLDESETARLGEDKNDMV